jgi:PAS domain S-box-containing protein
MASDFRQLVDALPGLIWVAAPDGTLDYVNRGWRDYSGLSDEQAAGRGWQSVIHPDDVAGVLGAWADAVASGEGREVESRMRRFDGVYRAFLFRTAPLIDDSGRVAKWCGINTDVEDRKQADLELRAQQDHFRSAFDGLPIVFGLTMADGKTEVVNAETVEYFGLSLAELQKAPIAPHVLPEDRPGVLEAWGRARDGGTPYNHQSRQRRADGVYRWIQTYGRPLRDAENRIVRWSFLMIDIDEATRAEIVLLGERRLLEMVAAGQQVNDILNALCQFVEDTDPGARCGILFISPGDTSWQHGVGPGLPHGYHGSMERRPADGSSGPCGLAAALKSEVIVPDIVAEDRWIEHGWQKLALFHGLRSCWSSPILSQAQSALGVLAIYRERAGSPDEFQLDLLRRATHIASIAAERAQADALLKRSELFLAETRRLSSTGGCYERASTGEITWSDEVYDMLGIERGTTVTTDLILTRIHPEEIEAFHETFALDRRASEHSQEYRILLPDGTVRHLHVVGHATSAEDGEIEYFTAVQDITERRLSENALAKARSELAQVSRLSSLGALTASIAHEVNQPLSGIITNASTCLRMLAADPPNVAGAIETARRTIRDGTRAADVIARLRAMFTKGEAEVEVVDLNEAVREVIALSTRDLQRNRVILRTDLAADLPAVTGDRVQLQQVVLNLLLNGSDAMTDVGDHPRQMVVTTWRDGPDTVRLTMRDSGIGFEAGTEERIFQAFYTTKSTGMGIGLSVSRSIIDHHGGRLWAASNPDRGATFSFSLPSVPEAARGIEPVIADGPNPVQYVTLRK